MTVKELAHKLNRDCYLRMIEIDSRTGDYYPRGILHLREKENIELIEAIGDLWEIEDIDVSNGGELLTIMYKRRDENV